nr:probable nitronate monooxygenase [Nerophis lumbriciformis]
MTERFVSAAELMAQVLGAPEYRFVTIEHPISSASTDSLARRAVAAADQLQCCNLAWAVSLDPIWRPRCQTREDWACWAALRLRPDQVRTAISEIRDQTDQPFGVNIWLHDDVRTPPDPDAIPDDIIRGSQRVLNEFRPRFDLPATVARPEAGPDLVNAALEAALVKRFHDVGTKVVAMVATVEDAIAGVDNGADVIVAQGTESGGHRSYGTKQPKVGDRVPVVAAGGIVDGRGLAAMLALGADGVLLGSRFVATKESLASPVWKQRMTTGERSTTLTDGFTGQWARVLTSEFTERWQESKAPTPPGLLQSALGGDVFRAAAKVDDDQLRPLYAGAGVTAMHDIPGAGEVVTRIVDQARDQLRSVI